MLILVCACPLYDCDVLTHVYGPILDIHIASGRSAKYYDVHVCLSVCLSVRSHIA